MAYWNWGTMTKYFREEGKIKKLGTNLKVISGTREPTEVACGRANSEETQHVAKIRNN